MARKPKTLDDRLAAVEKKIKALREAREKRRARLNGLLDDLTDLTSAWQDDASFEADELDIVVQDLRDAVEGLR